MGEAATKLEYESMAGLLESRLINIRLSFPVGSLVRIGLPLGSRIKKENWSGVGPASTFVVRFKRNES